MIPLGSDVTSHLVRLCHVASVSYTSSLQTRGPWEEAVPWPWPILCFFLFLPSSHGSKRTTEWSIISAIGINIRLIPKVYMKTRSRWGTRTPDNPWSLTNEISLTLRFHIWNDRKSKCLLPLPRPHVCAVVWASQTLVDPLSDGSEPGRHPSPPKPTSLSTQMRVSLGTGVSV